MHRIVSPKVLYFGTPVILVSSMNPDGSPNLAPISSAWWLYQSCMIGMGTRSQTVHNLERHGECVLNLPSAEMVDAIDRLALTTGRNPVPEGKKQLGYAFVPDKFEEAGLTPLPAELVRPPRVAECLIHMEARVDSIRHFGDHDDQAAAIELRILKVHADDRILNSSRRHHIDPDKWRPLIMNFCEFYGLGPRVHPSRLAEVF